MMVLPNSNMDADWVINHLELQPHPEGGFFRETWRAETKSGERATGTAIYFLLKEDEISIWHRVDAAEIWHWYAGAPLALSISEHENQQKTFNLGSALAEGHRPQIIVPVNAWQSARSLGAWSLVGCTVSPGFTFEGFEMAPANWAP